MPPASNSRAKSDNNFGSGHAIGLETHDNDKLALLRGESNRPDKRHLFPGQNPGSRPIFVSVVPQLPGRQARAIYLPTAGRFGQATRAGSLGPSSTSASTAALSAPVTMKITLAARFSTGKRQRHAAGIELRHFICCTTHASSTDKASVCGNSEAVCPSLPMSQAARGRKRVAVHRH